MRHGPVSLQRDALQLHIHKASSPCSYSVASICEAPQGYDMAPGDNPRGLSSDYGAAEKRPETGAAGAQRSSVRNFPFSARMTP